MARLQWTPLAIPDIGDSSLRAQSMAGNALTGAIGSLKGAVNAWEADRRDANMVALINEQNKFAANNDVEGYLQALADGSLLANKSYLRPDQVAGARSFANELRTSRNADYNFARQQLLAGREDKTYERNEKNIADKDRIYSELYPLYQRLQTGEIGREQFSEVANRLVPGLSASNIDAIMSMGDQGVRTYKEDRNSDLQFQSSKYNFDRGVLNDQQNDRAEAILNELTSGNVDSISAHQSLNTNYGNEDPRVLNAVRNRLPGLFSTLDQITADDGFAMPATGGGGGTISSYSPVGKSFAGGATNALSVMNYNARNNGVAAIPDSVRTYGDLDDFGSRILGIRGVTSTASGPYQITRDTRREFAPKVLGADWRSQAHTEAAEERIAEAIFNDAKRKGSAAISGRWAAIDAGEARRLSQMTWDQARHIIARKEGGAVATAPAPQAVRDTQAALQAGLAVGPDRPNGGNRVAIAAGYADAISRPTMSADELAYELINGRRGEDGKRMGEGLMPHNSQHRLRADIERLARDTGVSYSVAAWAIGDTRRNTFIGNFTDKKTGVDMSAARARIAETKSNAMRDQVSFVQQNRELAGQVQAAEAAVQAAQQRLNTAQARLQANGGRGDISRYVENYNAAVELLTSAREAADNAQFARGATSSNAPPIPSSAYRRPRYTQSMYDPRFDRR